MVVRSGAPVVDRSARERQSAVRSDIAMATALVNSANGTNVSNRGCKHKQLRLTYSELNGGPTDGDFGLVQLLRRPAPRSCCVPNDLPVLLCLSFT
jgi:hypothetical protein